MSTKTKTAEALRKLLKRDQRNTCTHEETHRGGAIWEICDQCGAKWADDEGGKPEWKDPPEWLEAEQALAAHDAEQAQEPVATYMGHRLTPEGTQEFWGYSPKPLPSGANLYAAPVEQAAQAVPADLYVGLIERLMKLSTRLGLANGDSDSVEHFAASLEDRLYAICRCAESLLDSLAAKPAAPAPEARCDCGKKPTAECDKWEPGCDLGHSPEHARVVRVDVKAQAAGQELPDTESVTACWQDFGRTEEFRRSVKWSQNGEIPGALFVAFRAGLRAASPKALAQRQKLTDEQILACVRAVGTPAPMGLTRDRGPYEVTEPTWFLTQLVRAIERAIGGATTGEEHG